MIVDRESLDCDGPLQPTRACPLYTQLDLAHMLPAFSVRRSFLLRSGIQEYLLARDAEGAVKPSSSVCAGLGSAPERTCVRRSRR